MRFLRLALVMAAWLCAATAHAQQPSTGPLRPVNSGTLVSAADPAATLSVVDPAFSYAGGQRIDIFKVAEADQHFFIDAAPDKSIRRFYWLQFEHFYPENGKSYNYSGIKNQQPVALGRLQFTGDVRSSANYFTHDDRAGSDSKAAENFLRGKGYKLDGAFVTLRMFHVPDEGRHKELMIIYGEVLPDPASEVRMRADITWHAQVGLRVQ